jgi:hypothetical protein
MMRPVFMDTILNRFPNDDDYMGNDDREALVTTLQEVYDMSRNEAMENVEFLQRSSEPM